MNKDKSIPGVMAWVKAGDKLNPATSFGHADYGNAVLLVNKAVSAGHF